MIQEVVPQPELMNSIGFTDDDLAANRNGQLSAEQSRKLRDLQRYRRGAAVIWVSMFLLAILSPSSRFFAFSVIAILMITESYVWKKYGDDLRAPQIGVVQGIVKLNIHLPLRLNHYSIMIENLTFNVSKAVFLAFKNGESYSIYYAPRSRMILSAEWLREG